MKLEAAALIILIVIALGWAIWRLVSYALRSKPEPAQWRVEEHTEADGSISVWLRKAGEAPRLIKSDEDIADALADLRLRRESAEALRVELERKTATS